MKFGLKYFVNKIHQDTDLPKSVIRQVLLSFFKTLQHLMIVSLPKDKIELRGVGQFIVKVKKPRKYLLAGRMIFTGWRKVFKFKVSSTISSYLDLPDSLESEDR